MPTKQVCPSAYSYQLQATFCISKVLCTTSPFKTFPSSSSILSEMASPTPTSDPVTASPTPTVPDPSSRPDKPIMGNIVTLSKDDWSAWTGSKPAPGWVGLDPSAADDLTLPNQLCPVHASASQKGNNFCCTGMMTLFMQASSPVDFQNAVWDHLTDCGMDTIAYLPNPENALTRCRTLSRVTPATPLRPPRLSVPSKFSSTTSTTKQTISRPPSSFSPLLSKIKEKTEDNNSFHVVWLQLIKRIQSTSIERFEDLKAAVKACHTSQYAGKTLRLSQPTIERTHVS
jgi:hypothetical protein